MRWLAFWWFGKSCGELHGMRNGEKGKGSRLLFHNGLYMNMDGFQVILRMFGVGDG